MDRYELKRELISRWREERQVDRDDWREYYFYSKVFKRMDAPRINPFELLDGFKKMADFDKTNFLNLYIFNNVRSRSFDTDNPYKQEVLFTDIFEAYYAFLKQIKYYEMEEEKRERDKVQSDIDDYLRHMARLNMHMNSTVPW
jgi:hypothetical protein